MVSSTDKFFVVVQYLLRNVICHSHVGTSIRMPNLTVMMMYVIFYCEGKHSGIH
jgi:hypothetical protein